VRNFASERLYRLKYSSAVSPGEQREATKASKERWMWKNFAEAVTPVELEDEVGS
jgi:hypothetical protein